MVWTEEQPLAAIVINLLDDRVKKRDGTEG